MCAERLAETKMKELQARNEEDRSQQMETESWQKREGEASTTNEEGSANLHEANLLRLTNHS